MRLSPRQRLVMFLFILADIAIAPPALAAPADHVYSVDELVEIGVSRNPELKAERLETAAARDIAGQAAKWENPTLAIGGGRKSQPEGATRSTSVELSQPLPRPGRQRARARIAEAGADAAEIGLQTAAIRLRNGMRRLIYDFAAAREKEAHALERVARFKTVQVYLASRVFASPQKRAEAGLVRAKLLILGRESRGLKTAREVAWSRLNLHLGLAAEPKIQSPWPVDASELREEDLLPKAERSSPALRTADLDIRRLDGELTLARTEAWPGLSLNAGYDVATGADPERIYSLGVSFPLPVLNTNSAAIRAAADRVAAERIRREWAEQRLGYDLRAALARYRSAKISAGELEIDRLPGLEREMRTLDRDFKRGQIDLLTYIEADAAHFETLNAMLDAQLDLVAARAEILELIGEPLQAE
jgi:cobalt-zinc-cadmium efflux system outer membrane protein